MKHIVLASLLLLASCKTPEQNARLASIVDLALNVAVRKGAISPADAADVRAAETVVLNPAPTTAQTPSGK